MSAEALAGSTHIDAAQPRLEGMWALFRPRSVAVIGASAEPEKIGGRPIQHLLQAGFTGPIYPINPRHEQVQGLPAYASLRDVDGAIDLAIIAVPSTGVLSAVRDCADRGVTAAVLFSAGFAEAGPEGALLQQQVVDTCAAAGMRLLGPNCIGAANGRDGVSATFAFTVQLPKPPGPLPRIALISQSGAIGGHCVALATRRNFEFDPWITTGNEADVDVADCLAYLARDESVAAVAVYLEGCRDGARLKAALATAAARGTPVVVLKAGQSDVGARAAASHTASLVGSDQAYDALFHRYNACRVDSIAELVDMAHALAVGRPPAGTRTGIVTGSGGAGILTADSAVGAGLEVPPLPARAQERLRELWPFAGVTNPIDMTAQVTNDPGLLTAFLRTVLDEADYDVIVLALTYLGLVSPWSDNVVASLEAVRASHPRANLVVSVLAKPEVDQALSRLGIPAFVELSDAVRATARLARLAAGRARAAAVGVEVAGVEVAGTEVAGAGPAGDEAAGPAVPRLDAAAARTEAAAKRLLAAAGVPVVPDAVAHSAERAAAVAAELGFPVVMKVLSPDIPHKTEVGGVVLGVTDRAAATAAYDQIMTSVGAARPDAEIAGVLVAPMISGGVETILGVRNDPSLGPVVMFGLGGVFVEVLGDVSYRLAPFDVREAEEMIREVRGFGVLAGARGGPAADLPALAAALSRLSVFAAANADRLDSIDVNPFLVRPEGQGALAVDALITLLDDAPGDPRRTDGPVPEAGPRLDDAAAQHASARHAPAREARSADARAEDADDRPRAEPSPAGS